MCRGCFSQLFLRDEFHSGGMAGLFAYVRCMRSHGIADFPDPTPDPGGSGGGLSLSGRPGSDLNPGNPQFSAANRACHSLQPGGSQSPQSSAQRVAAAVKLAHCMRSHGVPSFPDPNGQGAFDRNKLDASSPSFEAALKACRSVAHYQGAIGVY